MANTAEQKEKVISNFVQIYTQNFGDTTAQMYQKFYAEKNLDTILMSAKELLEEALGATKAKELVDGVYKQNHLEKLS